MRGAEAGSREKLGGAARGAHGSPHNLRGTSYTSKMHSRVPPAPARSPPPAPGALPLITFLLGTPKCRMQEPGRTRSRKSRSGPEPARPPRPSARLLGESWRRAGLQGSFSQQVTVRPAREGAGSRLGCARRGSCSAGRFSIHSAVASGKPSRPRPGRGRGQRSELGIASPHQAGPESRAGLPCPPGTSQRALGRAEGICPLWCLSGQQAWSLPFPICPWG